MPLAALPEKTDGSIGRIKSDHGPVPTVAALLTLLNSSDLDTKVPAAEYERLKDAIIQSATAIGLGDGSTPGSLEARIQTLGLSAAHAIDPSIAVTAAGGSVEITNSADATDLLSLERTFAGGGAGVSISMGAGTTGAGIDVSTLGASRAVRVVKDYSSTAPAISVTNGGAEAVVTAMHLTYTTPPREEDAVSIGVTGGHLFLGTAASGLGGGGHSIFIAAAVGEPGDGVTQGGGGGSIYIASGYPGADGGAGAGFYGDITIQTGGDQWFGGEQPGPIGPASYIPPPAYEGGSIIIGEYSTNGVYIGGVAENRLEFGQIRAAEVLIAGHRASLGSVVIEATDAASSVRVDVAGTEKLRVTATTVLVPDAGIAFLGSTTTRISQSGGLITVESVGATKLQIGSASALFSVNASPNAANTRDLGASGLEWRYLYLSDGTAANPAVRFNDGSGVYQSADSQVAVGIAGSVQAAFFTSGGVRATPSGNAANPAFAFGSGPNCGLFVTGNTQMGVSTNSTQTALITGLMNNATGDQVGWDMAVTVNKATSGNYTALRMFATETSAPGTDDRLLDLGIASVGSKMSVGNDGCIRSSMFVEKPSNESVLNSTALQDDDHLVATLGSGATYHFRFHVFVEVTGGTSGFKFACGGTATVARSRINLTMFDDAGNAVSVVGRETNGFGTAFSAPTLSGFGVLVIEGTVTTQAAGAGTIKLQFAQNTLDAANAVLVNACSTLMVHRCAG
jgi:hypothetical protein